MIKMAKFQTLRMYFGLDFLELLVKIYLLANQEP